MGLRSNTHFVNIIFRRGVESRMARVTCYDGCEWFSGSGSETTHNKNEKNSQPVPVSRVFIKKSLYNRRYFFLKKEEEKMALFRRVLYLSVFVTCLLLFVSLNVTPSATLRATRSVPLVDQIIRHHAAAFDNDLQNAVPYKNHCYRVYNLALNSFPRKLSPRELELLAIATAFHDLGVWTHKTLDYLAPSEEDAAKWMKENGFGSEQELELVKLMIEYHHKITKFDVHSTSSSSRPSASKSNQDEITEEMVERLRRGDWIDVTFGVRSFDMDRAEVKALRDPFPHAGFYMLLAKSAMNWIPYNPLNPVPFVRL
jgi:hypothetical protein